MDQEKTKEIQTLEGDDRTIFDQLVDLINNSQEDEYLNQLEISAVVGNVNEGIVCLNKNGNAAMEIFTKNAIMIGRALILLKFMVSKIKNDDKSKVNWEDYSKKYITNLSERTRQKYMAIGGYKSSEKYAFYGIERLYYLISNVSKQKDVDDPVGEFIQKYDLSMDSTQDVFATVKSFMELVDVALFKEKSERKGIDPSIFDSKLIKKAVVRKKKLTTNDLDMMSVIHKAGGDPNTFLKALVTGEGGEGGGGNKKPKTIHAIIEEIKALIKYMNETPDDDIKIDKENIDVLITELSNLKALV